MDEIKLRPHRGQQELFLSSPADVAIYGGGAGGGKTWALLLEAMRHIHVRGFGAVVFRRESVQIANEGGLWDTAMQLYPPAGGVPRTLPRAQFSFPSGARVTFAHLNLENDVLGWQGSQIPLLCFDELSHFEASQFWYMLSRNRSTCGVRPYVRATTNPEADSWVAKLIEWWIDPDTGYPIPERGGVIRWFGRVDNTLLWADTPQQLERDHGLSPSDVKSLTFIPALLSDNPSLLAKDPGYLANLKALPRVERERLLHGNWKVKPAAGDYFRVSDFEIIEPHQVPSDVVWCRYWDRAATKPSDTNPDPDWTVGVKQGLSRDGIYYISHVERFRDRPGEVKRRILAMAAQDGRRCTVGIELDPGQSGRFEGDEYVKALAGYPVSLVPPRGSKETRAAPVSSQATNGNVKLVRGAWNEAYLSELENFPKGAHDDQVDATSGGFAMLTTGGHFGAIDWTPVHPDRDPVEERRGKHNTEESGLW